MLDSVNFGKLLAPFCIQAGLLGSNLQQMLLTWSVEFCRQNRQITETYVNLPMESHILSIRKFCGAIKKELVGYAFLMPLLCGTAMN